jgi:hypothetical protein
MAGSSEIKTRLPGRERTLIASRRNRDKEDETVDVAALADLLHETSEHHGHFEKVAPPHNWWDWYAAYMSAREQGHTPEEASDAAALYMKEVRNVVPR